MIDKTKYFRELLASIDPTGCNYQEWCNVGMALHHEGESVELWDEWSRRDPDRYHEGECETKWRGFGQGHSPAPVTGATITQMAKEQGYTFGNSSGRTLSLDSPINMNLPDEELGWNATIYADAPPEAPTIIDPAYIEGQDIHEPTDDEWNPVQDLKTYIKTLFEPSDVVGYVTSTTKTREGKNAPTAGSYTETAQMLLDNLDKYKDISKALGALPDTEAGAWIRFNPLDGNGVKNANVTKYNYALVECDDMATDRQNALIRQLQLPVACLVFSGKKSLHAIVHIDAGDAAEYRKRVEYLYSICKKNGLKVDEQNKNPSRLSRLPGVTRNGHKQFLIDTKLGKANFAEWQEWIEAVNDDLPEPENFADIWDNMPPEADPLINGVLRKGGKMMLAGASKAGKTFLLMELAASIVEGKTWLGFECTQGKVMYVNLELSRSECAKRIKAIYTALGWEPINLKNGNLYVWNLRGKALPMDKLAPKLIRRAKKEGYAAIIIDPIYKVSTGDENAADKVAAFCNELDKVCTELECSIIYCHHHSKGIQGVKKSMDRASGSGVFARDADALLDLIQLSVKPDESLKEGPQSGDTQNRDNAPKVVRSTETAWRIEPTLREFAEFEPVNFWFRYPIHVEDKSGLLKMADTMDAPPRARRKSKIENAISSQQKLKEDNINKVLDVLDAAKKSGEELKVKELAERAKVSPKTIYDYCHEGIYFAKDNKGIIIYPAPPRELFTNDTDQG